MPFKRLSFCLVIEETDEERVKESLLNQIDTLATHGIIIFDSEMTSQSTDVVDAEVLRKEFSLSS